MTLHFTNFPLSFLEPFLFGLNVGRLEVLFFFGTDVVSTIFYKKMINLTPKKNEKNDYETTSSQNVVQRLLPRTETTGTKFAAMERIGSGSQANSSLPSSAMPWDYLSFVVVVKFLCLRLLVDPPHL